MPATVLSEKARAHPFLTGLEPRQLEALEELAMEVEFEPKEVIFREGEPANRFYLILEGTVVLHETNAFPFQIIHDGSVLGWSAMFPPYRTQFEARALEKTKAVFFYGSRVADICETDHDLGFELMKRMAAVLNDRLRARRKTSAWWSRFHNRPCPEGNVTTRIAFRDSTPADPGGSLAERTHGRSESWIET